MWLDDVDEDDIQELLRDGIRLTDDRAHHVQHEADDLVRVLLTVVGRNYVTTVTTLLVKLRFPSYP